MFIQLPPAPVSWADYTMTQLRRKRYQACEKELAGLPQHTLFDDAVTDAEAESFFRCSWYAAEEKRAALHSIESLRVRVLTELPASMALLTPEEHDLMVRAVLFRGHMPLVHPESLFPAVSIVRRLWGRVDCSSPVRRLDIPSQVCLSAMLSMASDGYRDRHEEFTRIYETVDNTLYLAGMMSAESVMQDLASPFLQTTPPAELPAICRIALRAGFETICAGNGKLLLVHPGLANPQSLMRRSGNLQESAPGDLNAFELSSAYSSLTEIEDPLYDKLLGLIQDLCREGSSAEDTVEDLIILIKQGADFASLREVLQSSLVCLPTPEMNSALREMMERIPRWSTLQMGAVQ